jgi:hypothetical protein
MGHRGVFAAVAKAHYSDSVQQLLVIWQRAKGKERDAMLWGDEVRPVSWPSILLINQVEYLVVCIDKAGQKVRLSLRQADILASLSSRQNTKEDGEDLRYEIRSQPIQLTGQHEWIPSLPSRVWTVHAGGDTRKAMGHRHPRAARRRERHEEQVSLRHAVFSLTNPGGK